MSAKPKNKTPQIRGKQPDLIVAKIVSEFKDRTRAEIRKWRQALEMAGDVNTPSSLCPPRPLRQPKGRRPLHFPDRTP